MAISSDNPAIIALRIDVESSFGKKPAVHSDFLMLAESIWEKTRQHISETTLERVWNYSTRGYSKVSFHTLDLLAAYIGLKGWTEFCTRLNSLKGRESEFFSLRTITSSQLTPGDKIRFSWLPDRTCIARYMGNNRFIAETCLNSTIQPGDTFSALAFTQYRPLVMENFVKASAPASSEEIKYTVGTKNGIVSLSLLSDPTHSSR